METRDLTFAQRIGLALLWYGSRSFAMLPYWFKYHVVQNLLFFVLYYVLRYRMKVVKTNLRNSFPEKSDRELATIRRKYYLSLSEVFVDTVNMAHMTDRKARTLLRVKNLDEHRAAVAGRDWIAMLAHHGCWEYGSYWTLYEPSQLLVSVYHPLRSPVMEHFYRRLRTMDGTVTVAMHDSLRYYLRHRGQETKGRKNYSLGLIADQNPPKRPDSHWFRFLNQDTIFFDGGEKLALRCHLPVYFVRMERLQRGRYEIAFEQIYDGQEAVAENEITRRYVRKLEEMIRQRPELWLWSHRRWKRKREA